MNNQLRRVEFFVIAGAALVTLITLAWLLAHSRYGMDLTDESFYLMWMADPWIYPISATQFGFIYHPLHLLLHGDISLLRQANMLITFSLAWVLCVIFFRATIDNTSQQCLSWCSLPMLGLAAITATCSLIYFCPFGWIATPSYNSLIFQALLVVSIGLLLAEKTVSAISIIGWMLIGVGGWLAFMAKPSSAAALGLFISICLPLTGRFNFRLLAISVLTAGSLLTASAWVIDGSVIVFIERLKDGIKIIQLQGSGHMNMFRYDALLMGHKEQISLAFASVIIFGTTCFATLKKKTAITVNLGFALLVVATSLIIISGCFLFEVSSPFTSHASLLILTIPLSALAFGCVSIYRLPRFKAANIQWGIALYFAVLPHILAFGTNNNYWLQGSLGSLFWVLAGLVILMPFMSSTGNPRVLLPSAVCGQLITVFLLYSAMEHPYFGQPEPFRQYDTTVATQINKSTLILPEALADYYINIKKMADQAGFQVNTPIINMTGYNPGVIYAIGGKAIGLPWLIGGFSGSNDVTVTVLNRVSCTEIGEAWLLIDTDTPRKLSPAILNNFGIAEQDFEIAAKLNTPPNSPARWGVASRQLQLWKPTRPIQYASAACEKKRKPL